QVTILVSDLPDGLLGATTGYTIVLDDNAAGWGWFVDASPLANSEFAIALANGLFAADPASPAYGRMDLLTTVVHELGNAMGFAEDQGQDVTGATLQPGIRRVPAVAPMPPTVVHLLAAASAAGTDDVVAKSVDPLPARNLPAVTAPTNVADEPPHPLAGQGANGAA